MASLSIKDTVLEHFSDIKQQEKFHRSVHRWVSLGIHPHLEICYGPVPGHSSAYFVETIEGVSLTTWIKEERCALRSVLSLAMQICHGLEYLHANGVLHLGLSTDCLYITHQSLVKITDIARPCNARSKDDKEADVRTDIYDLGRVLWRMLCAGPDGLYHNPALAKPKLREDLRPFAPHLLPFLARCLTGDPEKRFVDVRSLRHALNDVYKQIYAVGCPYFHLQTDFRAESLNNQAVFLFTAGRFKEGLVKLQKALRHRDRLSEAVYNLIVYKLRSRLFDRKRLLLMTQSAMVDSSVPGHLEQLQSMLEGRGKNAVAYPHFLLCSSPSSLSLYRLTKKRQKKMQEAQTHLDNLRYEACCRTLLACWREKKFEKNPLLSTVNDRLQPKGDTREIAGVQRYATLKGFGQPAAHLAYLPGTRKIIESDGNTRIILRNYGPRTKISALKAGEGVTALSVSPDGQIIAAGTEHGSVIFWNSRTGKTIVEAKPHQGKVTAVDFCRDGRFFVSGGIDGRMVIRTVSTGREKKVIAWDADEVQSLAFIGAELDLVGASGKGQVKIWSARGRKCLHQIEAHDGPVKLLSAAPKGDFFATAEERNTIKIWDRHTGHHLLQIPGHAGGTSAVLVLDDNRHVATSGPDDMIRLWDLTSNDAVALLDGRGNGICCLARGSQPHIFFAGQKSGSLLIWKIIYNLCFD